MFQLLKNQVAIVTGASRGIGAAISKHLAEQGANVALLYNTNSKKGEDLCSQIEKLGVKVKAYQCDVADFEQTEYVVEQIIIDFGKVDILVNNAGITRDSMVYSMTEENFDIVIETNLKGAFNMIKHLSTHFKKQMSGRIINITSVCGLCGNPGQTNYASAKAGLIGLTKSIAKELAGKNVTCNAIAPGFIDTDMTSVLPEEIRQNIVASIPLKRIGQPEDVAYLTGFLVSPFASYITGEVIKIDGGVYI